MAGISGRGRVEKGKRLEREVVRHARAFGLRAERGTTGTTQQAGAAADTLIWRADRPIRIECRNRAGFDVMAAERVLREGHYQVVAWPERFGRLRMIVVARKASTRICRPCDPIYDALLAMPGWPEPIAICDLAAWLRGLAGRKPRRAASRRR